MKPNKHPSTALIVRKFLAVSAVFLFSAGALHANAAMCSYPQDELDALRTDYAKTPNLSGYGEFNGQTGNMETLDIPSGGQAESSRLFEQAKKLLNESKEERSIRLADRAAECGDEEAILFLSNWSITHKDNTRAAKYLDLGVKHNLTQAKYLLAEQYDQGTLGFPKDHKQAFVLYYAAAKDGEPKAMSAVAYYFARGMNGVQDDVAAIHWYYLAAKAGHVDALTAYGWMLENGKGAQVDKSEARRYYERAVAAGDKQAGIFLAAMNKKRSR